METGRPRADELKPGGKGDYRGVGILNHVMGNAYVRTAGT